MIYRCHGDYQYHKGNKRFPTRMSNTLEKLHEMVPVESLLILVLTNRTLHHLRMIARVLNRCGIRQCSVVNL